MSKNNGTDGRKYTYVITMIAMGITIAWQAGTMSVLRRDLVASIQREANLNQVFSKLKEDQAKLLFTISKTSSKETESQPIEIK